MGVGPCLSHTVSLSYSAYIAQGPTTCWYNIHKLLPIFWHSGHSLVLASVCQLPMNTVFFPLLFVMFSEFLPSTACSLALHICGRPLGFCRNKIMSVCDFRKDREWERISYAQNIKFHRAANKHLLFSSSKADDICQQIQYINPLP